MPRSRDGALFVLLSSRAAFPSVRSRRGLLFRGEAAFLALGLQVSHEPDEC
jgi:hypothetical protein